MFKKYFINIFILLLLFGCSDKSKNELFNDGIKMMNTNPRGAAVLFKTALQRDQNYFEARFQLARAYNRIGKTDNAKKELEKVLRQNPSSRDAHKELARVYLQQRKPDKALETIKMYLAETSSDDEAFEIAGRAYAMKGENDLSMNLLKKSMSLNGDNIIAGISLAQMYMSTGMSEKALTLIEEVVAKHPQSRRALLARADVQIVQKDPEAAMETYNRILQSNPEDLIAHFKKGLLLVDTGHITRAHEHSQVLMESYPRRPEGFKLEGIVYFYEKKYGDAIINLQKSLAFSQDAGSLYYLGLSHYYNNEMELALRNFYRSLDANPSLMKARIFISMIHLQQRKYDDAITVINKLLRSDEKNALAHNILGSAYMAKGMSNEAMAALNTAIELDPELTEAHIKKGLYSIKQGNLEEAEVALSKAVSINPDLLNSRVIYASYYMRQKDFNKAIAVLNEGIRNQKEDAILLNIIAKILFSQNNVEDATNYIYKAKEIDPDYHASYFNMAEFYIQKGDYQSAITELRALVQRAPENVKALIYLAALHEIQKQNDEALKLYLNAKKTGNVIGYSSLSNYYLRKGEPDKALEVLDEALKDHGSEPRLYVLKGQILVSARNEREAIKTYEQLQNINYELGYSSIINTFIKLGKPGKALARVKQEVNKHPEKVDLKAELVRIYLIMDRNDDAQETATRLMNDNPDNATGYIALALVYRHKRELNRAGDLLKKAIALDNRNVKTHILFGQIHQLQGDHNAALDVYNNAEKIAPTYIPLLFQKGSLLQLMGKNQEAIAQYNKILGLARNHIPTLNNLAYLYADNDIDPVKALQLASRAYVLDPGNINVQDTLGLALLKNKKNDDALRIFDQVLKAQPDNPSILYHAALAHAAQGNSGKAMDTLRKALQFDAFPESKNAAALLNKLESAGSNL